MDTTRNYNSRKDLIINTIIDLLREGSLEDITFARVADRCHLHPTSVTYYFESKDDMLLQCLERLLFPPHTLSAPWVPNSLEVPDAVDNFCRLIDSLLKVNPHMSSAQASLYSYLLFNGYFRPETLNALKQIEQRGSDLCKEILLSYEASGILEMSRFESAFRELDFISTATGLSQICQIHSVDEELVVRTFSEHLKKLFLKDGLYTPKPLEDKTFSKS